MRRILFAILLAMTTVTSNAQSFDFNEVDCGPEATTFQLFAPATAKRVVVRIYNDGIGGKPIKTVKMRRQESGDRSQESGVWQATIKGNLLGKFYTFDMGKGECPGVFAKAVGVNGQRGAIVNLVKTDPEDWCCDAHPVIKSPADLVVYEMHHRDFSIAHPDAKYPGKFLALTESWAIDHLKSLGVNAVHILPSYDYGSVDETRLNIPQYNWGYDPVNYNVPEGGYSTDPYDPACRILEFKQMVQALHNAGIAIILDVVYNHTYDIDHSNFQRTYPDYYYRKEMVNGKLSNGKYSNGSGCGNETASDQPMMRKFMIESVKYWIKEYHIDGFRFDLMGCHDIETMNEIRKAVDAIDPTLFIYGEGWSAGQCALPTEQLGVKANIPQMPRIAAFSDEIRDALRGPFDDDTKGGFLAGVPDCEESLKFGIVGAIAHPQVDMSKVNYSKTPWATEPTQMMSYVSCHDDMCLVDRLRASIPGISDDELIRLDLLAQTAVFTSQGVPFMLSGEELLRNKKGVHNSFESPDSINRLDWKNLERYPQVFKYYQDLIALRKHHPAFRLGDAHLVRKHLEFLEAPKGVVAFRLKDYAGRDDWRNIVVILNANREQASVTLPKAMYTIVCQNGEINEASTNKLFGRRAIVEPQSAMILHD
jgi:pullulanase